MIEQVWQDPAGFVVPVENEPEPLPFFDALEELDRILEEANGPPA